MAFLPTAAADVRTATRNLAHEANAARPMSLDVNNVLLAVMSYSQAPNESDAIQIAADVQALAQRRSSLSSEGADALDVFASHVRTVLREQPQVKQLLDEISVVPTSQHIDAIDNLLNDRQRVVEHLNDQNRMYLMIVATALAGLLLYAGTRLIRSRALIDRVNQQLCEVNAGLEQRVVERTEELSVAQGELLAAARQAGMAEIANNVLHNVGNVLNSVNVSAGLVSSKVRESKLQGLVKAVQLLDSHTADLGGFLTADEKGKVLPGYLSKVTGALSAERQDIVDELDKLTKSVDHIKDIVATQQAYSGSVSTVEVAKLSDLFEDALRMNAGALSRHRVGVTCHAEDIPPLLLDKHRLLQILVNLISNAKNAMDGVTNRTGQIDLRALVVGEDEDERRVRISVTDNGCGIAADHLSRIFVHGFTTRKNGHGFGLHSCAIAAKDMGGTLSVSSDGCDKGTTFTLEIPYRTTVQEKVAEYA
jgi:signal transduction histidine kinase